MSLFADEDGEDAVGHTGDYDEEDDEEEDEDGSEGGEVGLSFQGKRGDQVGNSGFSLQVNPEPAQTRLPQCTCPLPGCTGLSLVFQNDRRLNVTWRQVTPGYR